MIKFIITIFCMGLFFLGQAQCTFHKLYDFQLEGDNSRGVMETSDGSIVAVGKGNTMFGDGLWIVKTDACGDTLWTRYYDNSPGGDQCNSVIEASDGTYVICGWVNDPSESATDGFLFKMSQAGDSIWYQVLDNGFNDRAVELVETYDGSLVCAGYRNENEDSTLFIFKTDSEGNQEWVEYFGGDNIDAVYDLIITNDSGYAVSGNFVNTVTGTNDIYLYKFDNDGNIEWNQYYNSSAGVDDGYGHVYQLESDSFLLTAVKEQSAGAGVFDTWIFRTNSLGDKDWEVTWNFPIEQYQIHEIHRMTDGNFLVGGRYDVATGPTTEIQAWLVKMTPNGDTLWSRNYSYYGGDTYNLMDNLFLTRDGGAVCTGYVVNFASPSSNDMLIMKVDSLGNICSLVDTTQGCESLDCNYITADFTIQDTTIMINDTAWVTATYNGLGTVTHWGFDIQYATSENSFTFPYTLAGDYQVQCVVTGPDGFCTDTVYQDIYIDSVVGIAETGSPVELKVFPNPSSGNFSVVSSMEGYVTVMDISGRVVFREWMNVGRNEVQIDGKGVYFLRMDGVSKIRKVVVR